MPRSYKKKWVERNAELFVEAAMDAASQTLEEICQEGSKIFDQCIDKFYEYETRSYYRHETGRGTRTGWNLYLANGFKKVYKNGRVVSFNSGWDSADMLPYKPWKDRDGDYHPVTTEYVLKNVMNGIRGLEDEYVNRGYAPYDNHWSATINSSLFGKLSGTPEEIFKVFDDTWKDVATELNKKYRREAFKNIKIRW
jgi:hypothetical protein